MTFGEYEGQQLRFVPTRRLLWLCSNALQCKLHPRDARMIIAELRVRFGDGERLEIELLDPAADLI